MSGTAWGATLQMTWVPTLRYWEQRDALMREVEDVFGLHSFRRRDDSTAVRLPPEGDCTVAILEDGMLAQRFGETGTDGDLMRVVEMALKEIDPTLVDVRMRTRHLLPLDGSFEEEVRGAMQRMIPPIRAIGTTDFAVTADGITDDGMPFQVNLGIVAPEEIELRMAGLRQQVSSAPSPPPSMVVIEELRESASAASLFVEMDWNESAALHPQARPVLPDLTEIRSFCDDVHTRADSTVEQLRSMLMLDRDNGTSGVSA